MNMLSLLFLTLFSLFSSFVMSYIALATVVGPWMGPTLMLLGLVLTSALRKVTPQDLLLPVMGGSLAGIIATCVSFSFPTYYFINKDFFMAWADQPLVFISIVAGLCIAAGLFALLIVEHTKKTLLDEQKLPFPVGKTVYDIAVSSDNAGSKKQLISGVFGTVIYGVVATILKTQQIILNGSLSIVQACKVGIFALPSIRLDMGMLPMFVSIGFIAGHLITIPLVIGAIARIVLIDPTRILWFTDIPDSDFTLAFCSGIVVFGALMSLLETPKKLWIFLTTARHGSISTFSFEQFLSTFALLALGSCISLLWYFDFSLLAQVYTLIFTAVCTYQLVVIAGKIGMALLGRFATFIMVPGMLIFGFSGLQATIVATFVELCGGIATELLFGLKTAELARLDQKEVKLYQVLGILLGAVGVAVAFWFLITHFELGSEQLFAQRAQGRALVIQAGTFNIYVLLLGVVFGLILHILKINSMLVLGGLLMSLSMILPLVIGGIASMFVSKKERFEPLCSGIYATNSIWIIIGALLGK